MTANHTSEEMETGTPPLPAAEPPKPAMGPGPGGIGALLREQRKRRGEDLRKAAQALRIRYPYLEAIEEERFERLPGATYATGFVRAYAEYLGLDSDEILRRFREETSNINDSTELYFLSPIPESGIPSGALILVGVVVALLGYGGWYLSTANQGVISDLVAPLPERLSALLGESDSPQPRDPTPEQVTEANHARDPVPAPAAEPVPVPVVIESGPASGERSEEEEEPESPPPSVPAQTAAVSSPASPVSPPRPQPSSAPAAAPVVAPAADPMATPAPAPAPVPAPAVAVKPQPAPASAPDTPVLDKKPVPAVASAAAPAAKEKEKEKKEETPAPAASPSSADAPSPGAEENGRVVLRARADSWVQVRDETTGQVVMTRLLKAGERYPVPDRKGLKLLTGNAGALEVLVDGKTVPSLGAIGAVRRDIPLDPDLLRSSNAAREGQ